MNTLPILLVEDNPTASYVTKHNLVQRGCQVSTADNAEDALILLNSQRFSVILMDIGLPDGNGLEISQTIRENESCPNQHTTIIVVTAHSDNDISKQQCEQIGINEILKKPLNENNLDKIMHYFNQ